MMLSLRLYVMKWMNDLRTSFLGVFVFDPKTRYYAKGVEFLLCVNRFPFFKTSFTKFWRQINKQNFEKGWYRFFWTLVYYKVGPKLSIRLLSVTHQTLQSCVYSSPYLRCIVHVFNDPAAIPEKVSKSLGRGQKIPVSETSKCYAHRLSLRVERAVRLRCHKGDGRYGQGRGDGAGHAAMDTTGEWL
jgi:hypothetical protein